MFPYLLSSHNSLPDVRLVLLVGLILLVVVLVAVGRRLPFLVNALPGVDDDLRVVEDILFVLMAQPLFYID